MKNKVLKFLFSIFGAFSITIGYAAYQIVIVNVLHGESSNNPSETTDEYACVTFEGDEANNIESKKQ